MGLKNSVKGLGLDLYGSGLGSNETSDSTAGGEFL